MPSGYEKVTASTADSRFPSFLQGFNRRWLAGSCKAVYVCYDTAGTAAAVNDAINLYGSNVKIKSGGHCYEDFVFNSNTQAIIDVSPMNGYGYDTTNGYYLESGGTNWSAFQALFRDYGLVLPAGSCYSVGLGGHICGGGYGLLSRLNGLTVDWLTGVELIIKDKPALPAYPIYVAGNSVYYDQQALYWAHRGGGGGNFGVITKYYFKTLPKAPQQALLTTVAFLWSKLNTTVLGNLLNWFASFAQQTNNWRQFGIFALNHQVTGETHLTIQTAILDGEDPATIQSQYVDPVLTALSGIISYTLMTRPGLAHHGYLFQNSKDTMLYSYYEMAQYLNGSGANQRGKYKSAYMRKPFPADQVAAIYKWLTTVPTGLSPSDMSQSLLQIDTYGGQINQVASADTAVHQRSSIMKLQYQTYWTSDANDSYHLSWIQSFYADVYKNSGGAPDPTKDATNNVDGCYYNYPDTDLNNLPGGRATALGLYFGNNLARLRTVKTRWDPANYFNSSQSID